jgi:hypothetical protein
MRDTALLIPLLVCEVVPVIHVLVQELGLCVVHTVQAKTVKVLLNLCDCAFDNPFPVSTTLDTSLVRFRQVEVFFEAPKVQADMVNRFATLLVDGISISLDKCLEVLKDSLLFAIALGIHRLTQRLPEPSS